MQRLADNFLETLEMDLPGLITVTTGVHALRHVPLGGLQDAFTGAEIETLDAKALDVDPEQIGVKGRPPGSSMSIRRPPTRRTSS